MHATFSALLKQFLVLAFLVPVIGAAEEALTLSTLEKNNVKPLDDAALTSLVVGKTLVIRNRRTDKLYEATFYENGQRLLLGLFDQSMRQTATHSFQAGTVAQGIAPYKIRDGKLISTFSGEDFFVQIFKWQDKYVAANVGENGAVDWEILDRAKRPPNIKVITIAALQEDGYRPLDDKALAALIVGKTLIISNRGTGERFEATYSTDGQRTLRNITEKRLNYLAFTSLRGSTAPAGSAPYEIKDGNIVTTLNGKEFNAQVYKVDNKYYAAGGGEGGMVNWEIEQTKANPQKK